MFGGSSSDYRVASFRPATLAIFFPNWVARESAIGRSPLRFEDSSFTFSNWVEVREAPRGRLQHKAWIRLHNWPILCWNEEDVKAAIRGFRELWEVDPLSSEHLDVSYFRVNIRCLDISELPEILNLMVEDRRFRIPIEIEPWEEARPILLGEGLDHHLGMDTSESHESFLRQSRFRSVPTADQQSGHLGPRQHPPPGPRQSARGVTDGPDGFRFVQLEFPCLPTASMLLLLTSAESRPLPDSKLARGCTAPLRAAGESLVKTLVPSLAITTTGGQPPLLQPLGADDQLCSEADDQLLGVPCLNSAVGSESSSRLSSGQLLGRPALILDKGKKALSLAANMVLRTWRLRPRGLKNLLLFVPKT